jgi:hypothetical protein
MLDCFGSVMNTYFASDAHIFSPAYTNVAMHVLSRNGGRLTGTSKKSIARQTRLMLTSKGIPDVGLSKTRFWFLPWNKTNCHWTCWLVDTKLKRLVFFNPMETSGPECLKEWSSAHPQTATMGWLLDILEEALKTSFTKSAWTAWTFHPTSRSKGVIQVDGYNCGVYVILWIRALLYRPVFDGKLDFHAEHGDTARCGLLHLILQCFSVPVGKVR